MEHTKNDMAERIKADMRLLGLLAQNFPSVEAACTEIINLEAILNLPKGTESTRPSNISCATHRAT